MKRFCKKDAKRGGTRYVYLCVLILLFVSMAGCAKDQKDFLITKESSQASSLVSSDEEESSDAASSELPASIYVYVCGAVNSPGVYALSEGARVYEAVDKAGGFSEDASPASINQARILTDGEEIYVPGQDEAGAMLSAGQTGEAGTGSLGEANGKININTADAAALQNLTGIGETKAASIVAFREDNGLFASVEDIKNVDGIGDKTYEKIKDEITVN